MDCGEKKNSGPENNLGLLDKGHEGKNGQVTDGLFMSPDSSLASAKRTVSVDFTDSSNGEHTQTTTEGRAAQHVGQDHVTEPHNHKPTQLSLFPQNCTNRQALRQKKVSLAIDVWEYPVTSVTRILMLSLPYGVAPCELNQLQEPLGTPRKRSRRLHCGQHP